MIESEAKTKWCPLSRVLLPVHQAGNRVGTFHMQMADERDRKHFQAQIDDCKCIASACMFWRWSEGDGKRFDRAAHHSNAPLPERSGYCGAAGPVTFP